MLTFKTLSMAAAGVALIALATANTAKAATVVVPNNLALTEGNLDNGFPFNLDVFEQSSQRYQQVFAASNFASFSDPQLITQIAFRPDARMGNPFTSTISNILIELSTTGAAPDRLSTTFADNVGADRTTVFSGSLSLSSANTGPANGPKDFDIVINLQNPFLYNPTLGNLLLDVSNFSGGRTTQFDAHFMGGDSVARVFSLSGNVNEATGSTDSLGLVAQFTLAPVPVPEPTSGMGLLAIGTLGALSGLLRKRQG
jgi:hypothetical protein